MELIKKFIIISLQITLLTVIFLIGSKIQQFFGLIIPGSVIGLIILFILLMTGVFKVAWIQKGASFMNANLVLFFIPATVGFINYYHLFAGKGVLLIIITIVSTLMVMIVSSYVTDVLAKRKGMQDNEEDERVRGVANE